MDTLNDTIMKEDFKQYSDDISWMEDKEMEKILRRDKNVDDAYNRKREKKEGLKKTGGAKSDSPLWNDED